MVDSLVYVGLACGLQYRWSYHRPIYEGMAPTPRMLKLGAPAAGGSQAGRHLADPTAMQRPQAKAPFEANIQSCRHLI